MFWFETSQCIKTNQEIILKELGYSVRQEDALQMHNASGCLCGHIPWTKMLINELKFLETCTHKNYTKNLEK